MIGAFDSIDKNVDHTIYRRLAIKWQAMIVLVLCYESPAFVRLELSNESQATGRPPDTEV